MPHNKIGAVVYYHPKDRMLNTARGTCTITGLMPELEGQQPEYRIKTSVKNSSALRSRTSCRLVTPNMIKDDDPRGTKGAPTQRALRRVERNSDLKAKPPVQSRNVTNFIIRDVLPRRLAVTPP